MILDLYWNPYDNVAAVVMLVSKALWYLGTQTLLGTMTCYDKGLLVKYCVFVLSSNETRAIKSPIKDHQTLHVLPEWSRAYFMAAVRLLYQSSVASFDGTNDPLSPGYITLPAKVCWLAKHAVRL